MIMQYIKGLSHIREARRTSPHLSDGWRGEVRRRSPRLAHECMVSQVGAARRRFKVIETGEFLVEMNIH